MQLHQFSSYFLRFYLIIQVIYHELLINLEYDEFKLEELFLFKLNFQV